MGVLIQEVAVRKPNNDIEITGVYEDADAGRLTATVPVVPGKDQHGTTEAAAATVRSRQDGSRTASLSPPRGWSTHAGMLAWA